MNTNTRSYFDTLIPELNELLTRDPSKGLAVPTLVGAASSTLAIKGSTGCGKSVLATVLAYNLHYQLTSSPPAADLASEEVVLPFVFYFSFAQPSQGLRIYIDTILQPSPTRLKPHPF